MNDEFIFQIPFIKYQKVSGVYVVPMVFVGLGLLFVNIYLSLLVIGIAIGLFMYYRNSSKNQSALYFNTGLKHFLEGRGAKAKEYLTQATLENRDNTHAYLLLGALYYDEKQYRKAITNLKNGKIDSLENKNLNYILSECYYNIERYDKAFNYINDITYKNKSLENMRIYLLARVNFYLHKYSDALELIKKFKPLKTYTSKELKELRYYECIGLIEIGEINKGSEMLKELIKEDRYYRDIEDYGKKLNII